jgi:phosphopantothenoylcysteine decarboxylase/phosphopantothenate--cysteine ligase
MLRNRNILLCVTGGIAAYKACELARLVLKSGASIQVVMTQAATRFVTPLTFEALSGRKVAVDMFAGEEIGHGHLDLVRNADLMVVAPATADIMGKIAAGIADDLVSTAVLAASCPILVCPAMNPRMWEKAVVQENVQKLISRGFHLMDPEPGSMAHPSEEPGVGRLPEPAAIFARICALLPPQGSWSGINVIVSAGPTHEMIDPVRFLSNASSGLMGYALAEEARARGAQVCLISGPVSLAAPPGVQRVNVETTAQMREAIQGHLSDSQVLIMAAAPGDFKPHLPQPGKIKKHAGQDVITLELEKTPDILKSLAGAKQNKIFVGFALETDSGLENAQAKLKDKNLDLIVLNQPHPAGDTGLGSPNIQGTMIDAGGSVENLPAMPKTRMAGVICDRIQKLLMDRFITMTLK